MSGGASLAERIETIESGYEFMLAYAAQGREDDQEQRVQRPSELDVRLGQGDHERSRERKREEPVEGAATRAQPPLTGPDATGN